MEQVEKEIGDFDECEVAAQRDLEDVNRYSGELYDIICQACSGDALSIIRTVEDFKGFTAWHKLRKKFNPRKWHARFDWWHK